jgi:fucose permease
MTHSTFNCYNIEEIINKNKTIFSGTGTGTTIATVFKHHSNSFINNHMAQQVEEIPEVLTKQTEFTSNTKYAFWILAFIQLPAAAFLVFLKKKNLVQEPVIEKSNEPEEGLRLNVEHIKTRIATMPLKELTFLASAIVFLFEGLQASHGGYIFSYAVETYDLAPKHSTNHHKLMNKHPHSHNNNEAYITALFWAFFSIGRLASVFIATKISAPCMLFIDIVRNL